MKSSRTRTVKGRTVQGKASPSPASGLRKLMVYAPIALELLMLLRRSQKARTQKAGRGKYIKARKRDRALDFMLGQAQRRMKGRR
ncbi:hypothetical protein [Deinococcus arenicola]|uniref:Uncharacterized protein n=1 Tax=Deinococcus arenicola TaxID=2994950 RepID=A0ABU4DNA0_9DEIO|nr:hypothetical protein [Deinococcus sp. ZS9-10]MDV6373828.1 hypothetical protein [Deinococcus sp. ZS9-10]